MGSTVRVFLSQMFRYQPKKFSIQKLLKLCQSVQKWRLCIRFGDFDWTHPSGAWVMVGDAVHATLPYLASGHVYLLVSDPHLLT